MNPTLIFKNAQLPAQGPVARLQWELLTLDCPHVEVSFAHHKADSCLRAQKQSLHIGGQHLHVECYRKWNEMKTETIPSVVPALIHLFPLPNTVLGARIQQ